MIWCVSCTPLPRAPRCFLGSLGRYQISPVRLLLYQPCCPPAKQMTAPNRHHSLSDKRHVSPSPIHLSSISYRCQGRDCHANGLTSAAGREHRASRLSSLQLFGSDALLLVQQRVSRMGLNISRKYMKVINSPSALLLMVHLIEPGFRTQGSVQLL